MRLMGTCLVAALAGCGGASVDPGYEAMLRIANAQYVRGPMPDEGGGPSTVSVYSTHNVVRPGMTNLKVSGSVGPLASAVAIGLEGDVGYWIVPSGLPDVQVPELPTFDVRASFSRELPAGGR